MATAYAALVSLMNLLENIQHSTSDWIRLDREQIKSFHNKVHSLHDLLEDVSNRRSKLMTDGLENQLMDASHEAEDIIDSFVLDQIHDRSSESVEKKFTRFSEDIQKVKKEMDLIEQQLIEIKEKMEVVIKEDQQPVTSVSVVSLSKRPTSGETSMVGFDHHLHQIMESLGAKESKLQMISIVGMGGVGKTTLARNIYYNVSIMEHFHIRAWVTISQEYTVREILLALLYDVQIHSNERKQGEGDQNIDAFTNKMSDKSDKELGQELHQTLFSRRYLIVMDDIWSTDMWDEVRMFFPNNSNKSRIMITTRLSNLAIYFGSENPHELKVLDEDKSWKLFCEKVFPNDEEGRPLVLEKIGKEIVKNCGGLPLAIVVIAGLLANKTNRTREYWEHVAENLNSIVSSGDDNNCLNLLSLSYGHLPIHLKPCFLYMATFPEDCDIHVSRLVKLWVAEGFLKPIINRSLEDVANEYLKDLMDRNLILLRKRSISGKMKICSIHDLLRDLCLKEAHRESFLYATRKDSIRTMPVKGNRRICIHRSKRKSRYPPQDLNVSQYAPFTRSLVCEFECSLRWITSSCTRLLMILDVVERQSVEEITKLENLRYIACTANWDRNMRVNSPMSQLWNLQTLIGRLCSAKLPSEIWKMTQLRHVQSTKIVLPDPPQADIGTRNCHILDNLQTLATVRNFRCTEEVVKRVPNLRKLKVTYAGQTWTMGWSYYSLNNLVLLQKLESLTCQMRDKISVENIAFPHSLKKLVLNGCRLPWEDIKVVGSLPNLEVLKLLYYPFEGSQWDAIEGQFVKLKFLLINDTDLVYWRAEYKCFPNLEQLVLICRELEEVPVAESPKLQSVHLESSKSSVVTCARQILEERDMLGNEEVLLFYFRDTETKPWISIKLDDEVDIEP